MSIGGTGIPKIPINKVNLIDRESRFPTNLFDPPPIPDVGPCHQHRDLIDYQAPVTPTSRIHLEKRNTDIDTDQHPPRALDPSPLSSEQRRGVLAQASPPWLALASRRKRNDGEKLMRERICYEAIHGRAFRPLNNSIYSLFRARMGFVINRKGHA